MSKKPTLEEQIHELSIYRTSKIVRFTKNSIDSVKKVKDNLVGLYNKTPKYLLLTGAGVLVVGVGLISLLNHQAVQRRIEEYRVRQDNIKVAEQTYDEIQTTLNGFFLDDVIDVDEFDQIPGIKQRISDLEQELIRLEHDDLDTNNLSVALKKAETTFENEEKRKNQIAAADKTLEAYIALYEKIVRNGVTRSERVELTDLMAKADQLNIKYSGLKAGTSKSKAIREFKSKVNRTSQLYDLEMLKRRYQLVRNYTTNYQLHEADTELDSILVASNRLKITEVFKFKSDLKEFREEELNPRIREVNNLIENSEAKFKSYNASLNSNDVYAMIRNHNDCNRLSYDLRNKQFKIADDLRKKADGYSGRFQAKISGIAKSRFEYYNKEKLRAYDLAEKGRRQEASRISKNIQEKAKKDKSMGLFDKKYFRGK